MSEKEHKIHKVELELHENYPTKVFHEVGKETIEPTDVVFMNKEKHGALMEISMCKICRDELINEAKE